jgi:hypothetical protein
MRGYTCSSALIAVREILYHPVKDDVELVAEIKHVLLEIEDAAEHSDRASVKAELAATVRPETGPANNARDAITILEGIMAVVHCDNPSQYGLSQARDFCNTLYKYIKSLPAPVA